MRDRKAHVRSLDLPTNSIRLNSIVFMHPSGQGGASPLIEFYGLGPSPPSRPASHDLIFAALTCSDLTYP